MEKSWGGQPAGKAKYRNKKIATKFVAIFFIPLATALFLLDDARHNITIAHPLRLCQ